uniref:Carboxypeptidase n=1 Tax=Plectus sambesii TaxID=2011161 RepID=A0A914XC73_9BILA
MSQKFTDNQGQINYASTDQFNAFPCFSDDATQNYLNRQDVRDAIHIPATFIKPWTDCTDLRHWQFQYDDMTPVFVNILNSQYYANANFRMLIYNGDVDTVCNFLGDEWFIEALVKSQNISTVAERTDWTYQASADYRSQTGGYVKRFAKNLDQLTVKGSGHFVPQDRPGPALQMLMNFINKSPVYDTLTNIDVTPKPLLPQYAGTAQSPCPRKDADLIVSLPGLTFQPNFKQYSGYLNASANNFLHYWLVESQDNPATDPLILWLNGGPGCSSVGGFMTENGPFHPNQDGATLYENVYSWNKKANVLYLEAPRGVGYSYQTVDNQTWSDDLTAEDNYLALKDFFTNVFPEYATRQFFVTGESYGGVYIPTLAWRLFQGIQSGDISIKFQGVAIGNGVLSERLQLNSVVDFLYYHGIVGKDDWDFLMTNCCANVTDTTDCDFYQYMPTGSDGQPMPQPNPCGMKILMLGEAYVWGSYNDPYNIYQDCYRTKLTKYAAQRVFPHVRPSKQRFDKWDSKNFVPKQKFADNARQINYGSTDPFNGFPCWSDSATEMYMNRAEVRAALNIPDSVPRWTDCNDHILGAFVRQYLDMSDVMKNIINSPLYEQLQFRMLVYNGDVDTVCNFLGDEWFVENIVKDLNIPTIAARRAWAYQFSADYQNQTAGYVKRFGKRIDLLTVKGSGHYVPMDRPPQALQMLMNFIWNSPNYDQMTGIDSTPKPILPIFKSLGQCSAPPTQSSAATAATTTSPTAAPPGTTTTAPTPAPPATTTTAPTPALSGTTTTAPTAAPPSTISATPTAASNGTITTASTTPPPTSPNAAIRHINSISNALLSMILVVLIVARQ